ncbi:MAG: hypothetical protein H0W08_23605 [Acidobacteria bacterium]|nr:hypothetical protein [Acidobacteriota bacterium]
MSDHPDGPPELPPPMPSGVEAPPPLPSSSVAVATEPPPLPERSAQPRRSIGTREAPRDARPPIGVGSIIGSYVVALIIPVLGWVCGGYLLYRGKRYRAHGYAVIALGLVVVLAITAAIVIDSTTRERKQREWQGQLRTARQEHEASRGATPRAEKPQEVLRRIADTGDVLKTLAGRWTFVVDGSHDAPPTLFVDGDNWAFKLVDACNPANAASGPIDSASKNADGGFTLVSSMARGKATMTLVPGPQGGSPWYFFPWDMPDGKRVAGKLMNHGSR